MCTHWPVETIVGTMACESQSSLERGIVRRSAVTGLTCEDQANTALRSSPASTLEQSAQDAASSLIELIWPPSCNCEWR